MQLEAFVKRYAHFNSTTSADRNATGDYGTVEVDVRIVTSAIVILFHYSALVMSKSDRDAVRMLHRVFKRIYSMRCKA